jgi:flagellar motor switch protein FliN
MSTAPSPPTGESSTRRLDMLLDVPLDISVELGRCRMTIQDLLALAPGSVVELDKIAGEPLDILVNERLVARGEAVVVNDKFGVRITDIVSPQERIARLR